ncbi:MAG: DUF4118 domain-containing protein [Eubacteriales bacterium]|nr:DUF4118 domain-containing protein [Eubacteriales bacterium]
MGRKTIKDQTIWQSVALTLGILVLCTAVARLLSTLNNDNNPFAACMYVLGVALVARYTSGYWYGVAASIISVACVNFFFTYPFYMFNLSLTGYPLTFAVMLLVSVIISAMSTQLKRQERLRFEAQNESMRANLLRSISHDIRTPIASMLGASSVLLENRDLTRAEQEEMLLEIQSDARWLNRVTENILSVTKLNADGVKLQKSEEVVEEIVGSAIVKFRKRQDALPIQVTSPDDILLVPMEATLIEQVLINLFENVEAHGKTATKIDLDISRQSGRVVFRVSDDGIGFTPSALQCFQSGQPFSSGQTGEDGHRNMGIGLSVCQSIITAHGGGMSAYNNKAGGAAIEFWLPCEGENHG